jgi:hypothetical protein
MVDENDLGEQSTSEEETLVEPTPWYNSDTVATAFGFAAQQSMASAIFFQNLAMLAMGQSAHEWVAADRAEMVEDTITSLNQLQETEDPDG